MQVKIKTMTCDFYLMTFVIHNQRKNVNKKSKKIFILAKINFNIVKGIEICSRTY